MKQTIFDARYRAEELMKDAISIWQKSEHSEQLEGLENDPIISLLMAALAYLSNETDNDIERLKENVLEDYANLLLPFQLCHAMPASLMVSLSLNQHEEIKELDEKTCFTLNGSDFNFLPLIKSRVLGASVDSVVRLDGRRWKVLTSFSSPVESMEYFTFAIDSAHFQDLRVTLNGYSLPLIKPWDYAGIPFTDCFSTRTQLYNQQLTYKGSATWLDLFAQQDIRIFSVSPYNVKKLIPTDARKLEFIFEFTGINEQFIFDKSLLYTDCSILANVACNSVTLSSAMPLARVTGNESEDRRHFLQLLPPSLEQIHADMSIEVRRTAGDRFNRANLTRLINSLMNKLASDHYAFQDIERTHSDTFFRKLQELLQDFSKTISTIDTPTSPGVYLLFKHANRKMIKEDISLEVNYLTTAGSVVNNLLKGGAMFSGRNNLFTARSIGTPIMGTGERVGVDANDSLVSYYMITNDRIVTPADMKALCYKELMLRYSITPEMVEEIRIANRPDLDRGSAGYEFVLEIVLVNNPFIKRMIKADTRKIEFILKKLIEVRSTNIYPIQVSIKIDEL